MNSLEGVLSHFDRVSRNGSGFKALCPAHADKNPSLSITERDGKILLKCFAGCSAESICTAAGIKLSELFTDNGVHNSNGNAPEIVDEYTYFDENGEALYQVMRLEPKSFRQRRADGKGGWIEGRGCMDGVRRVLYNLRGIRAAEQVIVTEGERDANTVWHLGLPLTAGTTNVGGANTKWLTEYSEALCGKHVVVIPDNDEPGRKHAQEVAASVHPVAASLKIVELPKGKDLSEWVEQGGTKEGLEGLIKAAPLYSTSDGLFQTFDDFENAPPLSFAIENFLQNDGVTGVAGLSGHGKSWVMLSIVKALLAGPAAKLWDTFPVVERAERIVYLIPESTIGPFKLRLKAMGLYQYIRNGRLLCRTLEKGPLDLKDTRLIAAVKGAYIFLDTAIRFMSGDENSAEDNRAFAFETFELLKAGARSIVAAYHSPKSFRRDSVMDLEGILRGGGDLGAALVTCWAVKQIDAESNTLHIENVKPREFTPPGPFQLVGRPHIDNTGDFMLLKPPGTCGTLAEEAPPLPNGNRQAMRDAKASNKQLLKAWLAEDSTQSLGYLVDRFLAAGIRIDRGTISRYRQEIANEHQ